MPPKSSFLDKVLGRIGRLDAEGLQTVVQRLARERGFLETLFNTIEDGVLVVDEAGRILYFNQAVTRFLGLIGKRFPRSTPQVVRAWCVMNLRCTIRARGSCGSMRPHSMARPGAAQASP